MAAIRDFYDNTICIDREILPEDSEISQLDGMHYRDLPPKWQRQFRQYSVVIIRLTEYKPEEPFLKAFAKSLWGDKLHFS